MDSFLLELIADVGGGIFFGFLIWLGTKKDWLSKMAHWWTAPTTEMYKKRTSKPFIVDFPWWAIFPLGIAWGLIIFFINNLSNL